MTAFREQPAETAYWVRLLVEWACFWEMLERYDESGIDAFVGRLRGETTMAISRRSAGRRAVAPSTNWECCWWNCQVWRSRMTRPEARMWCFLRVTHGCPNLRMPGDTDEHSRNHAIIPERFLNSLKQIDYNGRIAGSADSPYLVAY
jgi:hypothetical protein